MKIHLENSACGDQMAFGKWSFTEETAGSRAAASGLHTRSRVLGVERARHALGFLWAWRAVMNGSLGSPQGAGWHTGCAQCSADGHGDAGSLLTGSCADTVESDRPAACARSSAVQCASPRASPARGPPSAGCASVPSVCPPAARSPVGAPYSGLSLCVRASACVCKCVRVYKCACECVCVSVCVSV